MFLDIGIIDELIKHFFLKGKDAVDDDRGAFTGSYVCQNGEQSADVGEPFFFRGCIRVICQVLFQQTLSTV